MDVTTTYELMIPSRISTRDDTAVIAVSDSISLERQEIHIFIEEISEGFRVLVNERPVDGERIAVITRNTPDKRVLISLEKTEGGTQSQENKDECLITFRAELVDSSQSDT